MTDNTGTQPNLPPNSCEGVALPPRPRGERPIDMRRLTVKDRHIQELRAKKPRHSRGFRVSGLGRWVALVPFTPPGGPGPQRPTFSGAT